MNLALPEADGEADYERYRSVGEEILQRFGLTRNFW